MILENSTCKIEVVRNYDKPTHACTRHDVTLLSGEWPTHDELITACDNSSLDNKGSNHFGGTVAGQGGNRALVTVYID